MLNITHKIKLILVSMLIGLIVSAPVFADDTEIYSTASSITQKTQPNVLFVLDTSGSMNDPTLSRPGYDPNTDYSGGSACYDKTRVYTFLHGWGPDDLTWWTNGIFAKYLCGASSNTFNYYTTRVNRTAVKCKAADTLETTGSYLGKLSQYRKGAWKNNIATKKLTDYVECQADSGIDGESAGNPKKWASSTNGPWSSNPGDSINWGNVGTSTTLYSGNYLNYLIKVQPAYGPSKIQVMQDVISNLVNSTTGINIGLMRFDRYNAEGGMVVAPLEDINTSRSSFITALNAMKAGGATPLAETLYESAMYYEGKAVDYGLTSQPVKSIASSRIGNMYKSPITDSCQKNFTILLTDGLANNDDLNGNGGRSARLQKLNLTSCSGDCLDEIAGSTGKNDQSPLKGKQVISTYTIGFMVNNSLLKDTADASLKESGMGKYLLANDASTLTKAFNDIMVDINKADTTFSAPAVSVNAFNRTTHLNDLYFTLFKPAQGAHWDGNFKKYKLAFFVDKNDVNKNGNTTERLPYIADASTLAYPGNKAVDPTTGFFAKGSISYWTQGLPDGPDVTAGGAASLLTNARKVYTYTGTYNNNSGVLVPSANATLTTTANAVKKTNTAITTAMLGITGLSDKIAGTPRIKTLLDWAAGIDVLNQYGTPGTTTDARTVMGDPLHSKPALIQYGGTATSPDLVAYVATNDGYLHAFNAKDGTEIFSFIPQALLPHLNTLMDDASGKKVYGLDGDVVAWVDDKNGDGIINGSDHVYLYVSMRRGGRNIYALDVTDRNNPRLLWVIKGGTGDYAELGQTWSSINVEKVKNGSKVKTVLIFGGGYDTNQDNVAVRTKDSMGRAVYIVDATTGKRLWMAGQGGDLPLATMQYSIPARVKPLDLNGDGLIDRLYVADMGGQIFRFDINNDNNSSLASSITGGRIADLAGSSKTDARRFYYPPDVALIAEKGKSPYLALAIASGYRAHPLNTTIHDRIYVLKDKQIYTTPASYTTLTEADLYDATLNLVAGNGTKTQKASAKKAIAASNGWYIKLDDGTNSNTYVGEKGLSEALIINGTAVVTTFTPTAPGSTSSCTPQAGTGKAYFLDILDGSAAYPSSVDKRVDRVEGLVRSGIPPSPTVMITKGGVPTLCIGTECQSAKFGLGVRKTFWYEEEK